MAVQLGDSLSGVIAHANSPNTGPTSGMGMTTSRTSSVLPTRSLTSAKVPSGLPAPLSVAIANASKQYGVDPSVLTGIWKIESGSSFPNPYVNKQGYGGLFGTHNWNAPVQTQANTAAQILSNLIKSKGSLPAALSAYSGGGYSSVDGSGGGSPPATLLSAQTGGGGGPGQPYTIGAGAGVNTGTSNPVTNIQQPFATAPPTDPALIAAQKSLANAMGTLARPGATLADASKTASEMISPQIQQLIAAGQIGANNILQFNRGQQQLLSQLPAQIDQTYNQAGALERQIAQSSAQALQSQSPNAADQAVLQAIGAPVEQQQQVATQNQLGYGLGGAVLQATGNLGALGLAQQGAAARAFAQTLPALSKIQAGQALSNYESNQVAALGKVLAQQPALAAKLFSTLQSGTLGAAKLAQGYISQSQNISIKKAGLNLDAIKASNSAVYQGNQIILGGERVGIDQQKADNQAIHYAAQDASKAVQNQIAQGRLNATVTHNAATLTEKTQNDLGFRLIKNKDGTVLVQPMKGYHASITKDGSVVTWKIPTGGPGAKGAGKGYVPGWDMTATSLKTFKSNLGKSVEAFANPQKPRSVQGNWIFPTGYSQADLPKPELDPGAAYKDANGNTLYNNLPPKSYGEALTYALNQIPNPTKRSIADTTRLVEGIPAYSTPGQHGRPLETYAQYLASAKQYVKQYPGYTVGQITGLMNQGPYFPDKKMLVQAITAAANAKALGPRVHLPPPPPGYKPPTPAPSGPPYR